MIPAIQVQSGNSVMVDLKTAKQRLADKKQELEDLSDLSADARDPVSLDHDRAVPVTAVASGRPVHGRAAELGIFPIA